MIWKAQVFALATQIANKYTKLKYLVINPNQEEEIVSELGLKEGSKLHGQKVWRMTVLVYDWIQHFTIIPEEECLK